MSTYTERLPYTGSPEYDKHFWNAMRGNDSSYDELSKGRSTGTGLYAMPNSSDKGVFNDKREAISPTLPSTEVLSGI